MNLHTDRTTSFDGQATAAVLRSGVGISTAGHVAALMTVLPLARGGRAVWIALGSLLLWSAAVYLGLRVQMDARFFELIANQPAEQLDSFLHASGLRRQSPPRTMLDRRRGALRMWKRLAFATAFQIVLLFAAILLSLV